MILRRQFLEAYDWFSAFNRGKVFDMWWVVQQSMNLNNTRNYYLREICYLRGGKGYFAAVGTIINKQQAAKT